MTPRTRASATRWYCRTCDRGFSSKPKLTRHCASLRHHQNVLNVSTRVQTEPRRTRRRATALAQHPANQPPAVADPNRRPNIRNAALEINARLTTRALLQNEITAEEGVIQGMQTEVTNLANQIRSDEVIVDSLTEHLGSGENIDADYVNGRIDDEKRNIIAKQRTLAAIQKDVHDMEVKVVHWKELMERV